VHGCRAVLGLIRQPPTGAGMECPNLNSESVDGHHIPWGGGAGISRQQRGAEEGRRRRRCGRTRRAAARGTRGRRNGETRGRHRLKMGRAFTFHPLFGPGFYVNCYSILYIFFHTTRREDNRKLFSPNSDPPYPSCWTHPSYVFGNG
jgi:hypothetical protein